jgi:hypothetical protein
MKKFDICQKHCNRETGKSRLQQTYSTQTKVVYVEEVDMGGHIQNTGGICQFIHAKTTV